MEPDDLAATIPEFGNVRGNRIGYARRVVVQSAHILVKVEIQRAEAGIRGPQPAV